MRQRWFGLLGVGPLVLLLALLPQLLYVDHWVEFVTHGLGRESAAEQGDGRERVQHEAHCHVGSAACSDQPVPYSVRVVPAIIELAPPELYSLPLENIEAPLEELAVSPLTEPPRL